VVKNEKIRNEGGLEKMKRIIVFIVLMFLLSSTHLVLAETRNVECTSTLQCGVGEACENFRCVTKPMQQPDIVQSSNPTTNNTMGTMLTYGGIVVILLLIIIIFILLRKKKNKGGLEK